ncbi:helix-turn-helix domain-containing protein [Sphingomonas canadensis]|uniref:Helix-turn-helix domain-containing protein n=1 Tax=Sphingomonas canadensis TaxID=1219257 RepID=A0ABW3H2T2_9SPHN|nr:helix-turn-helix domain-containing protein [Sphingomonas canadensis]MCW3834643.1 helix-turn-helix domain-containing protein [Sphingomonas canadensis]
MEGEPEPTQPEPEATLFPAKVGEKLRAAREAMGLDVAEIAARTRIPQRHLETIERSGYSTLPSITYALGFAKAYARAVGMDEVAVARELRSELGGAPIERPAAIPAYQASDTDRAAPGGLVWIGIVIALLAVAGAAVWYGTDWLRGGVAPPEDLVMPADPSPTPSASPVAETGGQVTLVALDKVWLRISDANGKKLFERELAKDERYELPQDADRPVIRTGRPEALQVLLNGSAVAPLGAPSQSIEVPVSADALRARAAGGTAPSPAPSASPSPATPSAAASRPRPRATETPRPAAPAVVPVPAPVAPPAGNPSPQP